MVFELPPYWEQIREESADDLQECKDNFSDYLLDKRIGLLSSRYNGFDLLFNKFDIYTTRFNSHTYLENQRYKENKMNGFDRNKSPVKIISIGNQSKKNKKNIFEKVKNKKIKDDNNLLKCSMF